MYWKGATSSMAMRNPYREAPTVNVNILLGIFLLFASCGGVGTGCYLYPKYNVYSQRMEGEAQLAAAESSRRIAVLEAQAKFDSAAKLAETEVIRASGVAKANEIIGKSLAGNEAYLRYLWIQGLQDSHAETIYIPTEANLPLLEASRRMPEPKP